MVQYPLGALLVRDDRGDGVLEELMSESTFGLQWLDGVLGSHGFRSESG